MDNRQKIITALVVVVALASAGAIGSAMSGSVSTTTMGPTQFATETPTSTPTTETPTVTATETMTETPTDGSSGTDETPTDDGGSSAPAIEFTTNKSGEIDEGETVALQAKITDADGNPVEGASVSFVSLGFAGEFKTGPTVTTNADGVATANWLFSVATSELSKDDMPPAAGVSMVAQTNVDGEKLETLKKLSVRVNCEECHEEGEYE